MLPFHSTQLRALQGLSEQEAAQRLKQEGPNELPSTQIKSLWHLILHVLSEPMLMLLLAAAGIYFFLGDRKEAIMLMASALFIIGITLYQERKTERALETLKDLSSPRALVIREGLQKRIPAREVVRGDILVLNEGDRIAADGKLLSCLNLTANESLLTGESVSVRKISWQNFAEGSVVASEKLSDRSPGGDDRPWVYSGTLIVQGQGLSQVEAIGINTEMGKIGKSLEAVKPEETPLKKESRKLVRVFATIGLSLCVLVALLYSISHHNIIQGLLVGVTLAMSVIPEEIPVMLAIFLALGAWRISKSRVLTRQIPAVETLGSATVLCVDKTGTITRNEMQVSQLFAQSEFYAVQLKPKADLPETFHEVVEFGILASQKDPFDPMEKAITHLGNSFLKGTEHLHQDWSLVQEYPLSHHLLALSHVWQSKEKKDYVIAAKGAPEAIIDLCHLSEQNQKEVLKHVQTLAQQGLRVLGVAKARFENLPLPENQHDFEFDFVGLIGFADPVRTEVPAAVAECHQAGVRVIMITGDYPATAQNIGRQIGLKNTEEVITGPELELMNDDELKRRLKQVNIFVRMAPTQKLRLVQALKANGEVVAMTGDGVNDAPALKAAHIGIAMGKRGTDVAREAASLVLLEDDFSSIVAAVKIGRRIYDNLKKAMLYIFAIHIVIAGVSLFPVLLGWPLLLLPMHIVFLELIIDPACSVVFEAEPAEQNVMQRPPRSLKESLFGKKEMLLGFLQGLCLLLPVLILFKIEMNQSDAWHARAMAFTFLIIGNLSLIIVNRSKAVFLKSLVRNSNSALGVVLLGTLLLLAAVLYFETLQSVFKISTLSGKDLLVCLAGSMVSVVGFECSKKIIK